MTFLSITEGLNRMSKKHDIRMKMKTPNRKKLPARRWVFTV